MTLDVDAIERLAEAATPGHLWSADWNVKEKWREGSGPQIVGYALGPAVTPTQASRDADFLEHAVTNTVALIARVRELEGENQMLTQNWTHALQIVRQMSGIPE